MTIPAVAVVALLIAGPGVQTVLYSVQRNPFTAGAAGSEFVGLANFQRVLSSAIFWHSLQVTAEYTLGFVAGSTLLGLVFALLLNERFFGRAIGRTLLIVPWACPWIVLAIVWKWFVDADMGALNSLLYQFGLESSYQPFLADGTAAMVILIGASVWHQASLVGTLILATLQGVPDELVEAAKVDGAGSWARFRYIVFPWIKPMIGVMLVANTVIGFLMFDVVYGLTQGGPGDSTQFLSILLYRELFIFNEFGVGSALAFVLGFVALAVGVIFARSVTGNALVSSKAEM